MVKIFLHAYAPRVLHLFCSKVVRALCYLLVGCFCALSSDFHQPCLVEEGGREVGASLQYNFPEVLAGCLALLCMLLCVYYAK